jgi:hypothetical protein
MDELVRHYNLEKPHGGERIFFNQLYTLAFKAAGFDQWRRMSDLGELEGQLKDSTQEVVERITCVTYNVWFENFYRQERYKVLL